MAALEQGKRQALVESTPEVEPLLTEAMAGQKLTGLTGRNAHKRVMSLGALELDRFESD